MQFFKPVESISHPKPRCESNGSIPPTVYVDRADDPIYSVPVEDRKKGGIKVLFPEKLHSLLSSDEFLQDRRVIGWAHHGRSFFIRQPDIFIKSVLPHHAHDKFSHATFSSFQRQLNLYGFRRIRKSGTIDEGSYYHELFLQGRPDLCLKMRRTAVKGLKLDVETYDMPKFYNMKPCVDETGKNKSRNTVQTVESLLTLTPSNPSMGGDFTPAMYPQYPFVGDESFPQPHNLHNLSIFQLRELALREMIFKNNAIHRAMMSSRQIRVNQLMDELSLELNLLRRRGVPHDDILPSLLRNESSSATPSQTQENIVASLTSSIPRL